MGSKLAGGLSVGSKPTMRGELYCIVRASASHLVHANASHITHATASYTQMHHASQVHMHHAAYTHMHHTSATHTTVPHTQAQHTLSTHIRITHHTCLINEVLGLPQSLASSQMTPKTALAHHLRSFLSNLHLAKMGVRRPACAAQVVRRNGHGATQTMLRMMTIGMRSAARGTGMARA